jgi:hypothetical protein
VPETDPRPVTFVAESLIVRLPEKEVPDCVICQVIVPGPDESDAEPVHVPLTLAGVDGALGEDDDPPPHEDTANARMMTTRPFTT